MGWIRDLFGVLKYSSEVEATNSKLDDSPMGWNIYVPANTTRRQFAEEFHKVHVRFKNRFLSPLLIIAERWLLPPYKHEGAVENNMYNRELVVFERAVNKAMEDMSLIYLWKSNLDGKRTDAEIVDELKKNRNYWRFLKTLKQGSLYISQMDSAYHEFMVFFMHRVYQEMAREFDGVAYNRIVYDFKAVNEANWLVIQSKITQKAELTVKPVPIHDGIVSTDIGGIEWLELKDVKKLLRKRKN